MKIFNFFFLFFLTVSALILNCGCGSLPDVSGMVANMPPPRPTQITTNKELLPPEKSASVMEQLKVSADQTDILQRHNALMESVSKVPLTTGNKVIILIDGQATYDAMFKAIGNAKANINLETFSIEDDEAGRKFVDMLLQKRAQGVQVNLIYDSYGCANTADSFFQRLRDGGAQVVEFNQQNPFKSHDNWSLLHRDHRKILIVDGKVAITGGINISQVYSSRHSGKPQDDSSAMDWRDTDVQIEGPAVAEFQKLFFRSWTRNMG